MNDRFKFRVWNKREDCYIGKPNPQPLLQANGLLAYFTEATAKAMDFYDIEFCTGLKDKNGKLIYEGDIMEHRIYLGNPELYVVKWSESLNGWVYQEAKNSLKISYILTEFTDSIIGNIHENPELLKEE